MSCVTSTTPAIGYNSHLCFRESYGPFRAIALVKDGGSPTPFDRIRGTRFGVTATDLVAKKQFRRMLCLKTGKMESVSLDEALEEMKTIESNREVVHTARAVGATFGDTV